MEKFPCLDLPVHNLLLFVFACLSIREERLFSSPNYYNFSSETKGVNVRGKVCFYSRGIAQRKDSLFEIPIKYLFTVPIFFFTWLVSITHI